MTTGPKSRPDRDQEPPLFEVRTLVILLASILIGMTSGTLTWAAETLNIWGAILAGFTTAGVTIPLLNKLVAH